jgi:hypothetical protein
MNKHFCWRLCGMALGSLVFAICGTADFLAFAHPKPWAGSAVAGALEVLFVAVMAWLIMFVFLAISTYFGTKQLAALRMRYRIVDTHDGNDTMEHEVELLTDKPTAQFLRECADFVQSNFDTREIRSSPDGIGFTATVGPFASLLFSHELNISISHTIERISTVRVATRARRILCFPLVDGDGVAIIAFVAHWLRGQPLPRSQWPRRMWKTVVSSAKSYGALEAADQPRQASQGSSISQS